MDDNIAENINCDVADISESIEPFPDIDDVDAVENLLRQQGSAIISSDENGLLIAWNELRASLRQLHRTIVPSTQNNKWQNLLKTKPSVNRIKYLSNMLLNHDPHQLFTKLNQLSQELCIELKVRLLTTVNDSPSDDDSKAFIHGMCESYQWVMSICEAAQCALERLDSDHLSLFGLNWVSVNMHAFYTTVFTDPDVQDYLSVCTAKLQEVPDSDTLECLTSLQRTLMVAEELWTRAEFNLHRYTQQMGSHKRIEDGSCTHETYNSADVKPVPINANSPSGIDSPPCHCRSCMSEVDSKALSNFSQNTSVEELKNTSKPCDCHFCNSANIPATPTIGSSGGPIVPISQPQLSLYPHIHGTSSDLVSTQSLEDIMPASASSNKPPPIPSHLLGSDMLTQQLLREWEMAYGDAISPPASRPFTTVPSYSRNSQAVLVNGLQNLSIDNHPTESMQGSNVYMTNNVSSVIPNSLVTTTVSSHHVSSMTTTSCGFAPISTLNGSEVAAIRDVDHRAMNGNAGVITHTKYSMASNQECDHPGCVRRSEENSISRESSLMCDSSGRDGENGMSSDEYEYTTDDSSPEHQENHCDCCYCHLLDGQQAGGRQRYNDRRDRLLKILARKKATVPSSSSSNTSNAAVATSPQPTQDINQIMNYIEGRRESREKKTTKKPRKKKEVYKKIEPRHRPIQPKKKSTSNEEEEEDGPLAELRRRAPDVTITVVKPGDRPPQMDNIPARSQISISRNPENHNGDPPHPLMVRPQQSNSHDTWVPPTSRIGANIGPVGFQDFNFQGERSFTVDKSTASMLSQNTGGSQGPSMNSLLKNLQPTNRNSNKDKDGSQMVTIKRVMDPVTADPRVTITLKGAEQKKDHVLLQLINGQALPRGNNNEENEPYDIPKGLTPEQAKRYRNKLRKERKKKKKFMERKQEEEEEKMQQLHIQKQQQLLLQQEKQIKQQQVALQLQQDELRRQQQQKSNGSLKNANKKGSQKANSKPVTLEMSKNYTLPPGVSINKVAGQPGMVTISNNFGGPQPFLSNPNVFTNSYAGSYRMPGSPFPSDPMATPYSYGTAWNENNSRKENVIVVDTKGSHSNKDTKPTSPTKKTITNTPKKGAKASVSTKKEVQMTTAKKDVKSTSIKKDVKANSLKKDVKANSLKKDVKANSLKKDVKISKKDAKNEVKYITMKKETKVTPLKKEVKTSPLKKDAKSSSSNKKDAKSNVQTKMIPPKAKAIPKKKLDDMTTEEKISGALSGEIDSSLLNKVQRKKLKKIVAVMEKEAAEQREEDELMDKMYKISLGNKPVKSPAKKVQQVVETVSRKQNKNNQSGAVVKRLQKSVSQAPKQEVSKLRIKPEFNKDSSKNQQRKMEEPKKQAVKLIPVHRKPDVTKQVVKCSQKNLPKAPSKPTVGPVVNKKQQPVKNARQLEKQESIRGLPNATRKNIPAKHAQEDEPNKKKKASKKKSLDDMSIDNIFTPKYHANLDETDREVEAFKRFLLENPKRNEKPKVKFNVKDIMITKKYG